MEARRLTNSINQKENFKDYQIITKKEEKKEKILKESIKLKVDELSVAERYHLMIGSIVNTKKKKN